MKIPKKKGWKKLESRRTEWRTRKTGKYAQSPERMPAQSPEQKQAQSPERMPAQSPERKQAQSPETKQAQSPERMPAQSPERKQTQSPERMPAQSAERKHAQSPERMPAQKLERNQTSNLEMPVHSNKSDKAQKEKIHSKNAEFQGSDLKENSSVNRPDSEFLYTAIPLVSAIDSWNVFNSMLFGSFHQNDTRFS